MIFNNGPAVKLGKLCIRAAECSADKRRTLNLSTYRARISLAYSGATRREREREREKQRETERYAAFCKLRRNRGSHVKSGQRDGLIYHRDEIVAAIVSNEEEDVRFLSRLIFRHVSSFPCSLCCISNSKSLDDEVCRIFVNQAQIFPR